MQSTREGRRVERVRHELRFRELEVREVQALGTGFVRIVLGGDQLTGFRSLGFDDHIKIFLAGATGGEEARRDYTPRAYDAERGLLTIDFALHGEGAATAWARKARVGDHLRIGGPRGSMVVPVDYDWHLLAGDATAVPAMARRIEELPAGARVLVVAQIDDLSPLNGLNSEAFVELRQVSGPEGLLAALRELPLPAGEGYAWCAGEAATMARVRHLLIDERGLPKNSLRVAAYWKQGAADFHEDLNHPLSE